MVDLLQAIKFGTDNFFDQAFTQNTSKLDQKLWVTILLISWKNLNFNEKVSINKTGSTNRAFSKYFHTDLQFTISSSNFSRSFHFICITSGSGSFSGSGSIILAIAASSAAVTSLSILFSSFSLSCHIALFSLSISDASREL